MRASKVPLLGVVGGSGGFRPRDKIHLGGEWIYSSAEASRLESVAQAREDGRLAALDLKLASGFGPGSDAEEQQLFTDAYCSEEAATEQGEEEALSDDEEGEAEEPG